MAQHSTLRLSRYVVATQPVSLDGRRVGRVVLATRTGARLQIAEHSWAALQAGRVDEIPESFIPPLVENGILVEQQRDELAEVIDANSKAIASNASLDYVIQPTAACQLGCGYCGQEHHPVVMDEATQDLVVATLRRRLRASRPERSYSSVNVGWFGAEPLMGMSAIRRLTPLLRLAVEAEGATYESHVVTNGLALSRSLARELAGPLAVSHVDVTLDGPRAVHDQRRHTKSGHGTFDQIWRNLLSIAADETIDFDLTLRCNVDASNADAVPELIALLAASPLADRARLYFSPVYAWGNDADEAALDARDFAAREIEWMSMQLERGMPVQLVPGRREVVCIAVQPDARVVDAYGSEYTCTEVPYVPAYGTPNSYETGSVQVFIGEPNQSGAPLPFRQFNDEVARGLVGCAECELLPICGGACPKAWQDGRVPCPSHKVNLGERLLLEVAQRRLEKTTR